MLNIILLIVLFVSFITDIRSRRILNIVTMPAILFGFIYHVVVSGLEGFLYSGAGFLLGIGLLLIPFILGGMGAGDVKLLGAIGALKGSLFVFDSFIYTCLIGGIMASISLIKQKQWISTWKRILFAMQLKTLDSLEKEEFHKAFPYGVPIVLGTLLSLGLNILR